MFFFTTVPILNVPANRKIVLVCFANRFSSFFNLPLLFFLSRCIFICFSFPCNYFFLLFRLFSNESSVIFHFSDSFFEDKSFSEKSMFFCFLIKKFVLFLSFPIVYNNIKLAKKHFFWQLCWFEEELSF